MSALVGNCTGLKDPDVMFPDEPEDGVPPTRLQTEAAVHAQAICFGCPVQRECLLTALARREEHGVWGGSTPAGRKLLLEQLAGGTGTRLLELLQREGG